MQLDLIVSARHIETCDENHPTAQRMGVWQGRIAGFDDQLQDVTATQNLNLPDTVIVPGFIDAHCHTTWWGLGLSAIDLSRARGLPELYKLIEQEAARLDANGEREAWINGTGFNTAHHEGELPDIRTLDRLTGDRPLYLRHTSGHSSITNTATLKLAGAYKPGFTDPVGGKVVRDTTGNFTGLVEEAAQSLVQRLQLPYSTEQICDALDAATTRYASKGITSFAEAGIGGGWIGHSPAEVLAYQRARATGRLHARAQLMPALDSLVPITANAKDMHGHGAGQGLTLGIHSGFGDDYLSLGHVKVFCDGSLLGKTAAVTESFCGHTHNTGYLLDTRENYFERVRAAYRAGWAIATHAIGDAAIDLALDLIETCQNEYGMNCLPNRVEHFGISRPEQVSRAAKLGVVVTPQDSFIAPFGEQFAQAVGDAREAWLYRGASLLRAGVTVAGSSDLPVAENSPLRGMQSSIDRLSDTGRMLGAADERLTPRQALLAHTLWAAKGMGVAEQRGSLREGKLADFVVLDGDPLHVENLNEISVLKTFVGGQPSFDGANVNAT